MAASPSPGDNPEFGRGTYSPLGGVGAPPRRFARHLPIEREGGTQFVAVEHVVAVHANAHYTYIFDGNDKLFCPLAIGDVESRLDKSRFIRVHRSHIINLDHVVGYKRSGDNELVQMAAMQHYAVPVSRSRIGLLEIETRLPEGGRPGAGLAPASSSRSAITAHFASVLLTQFVQEGRISCGLRALGAALSSRCTNSCCCNAQLGNMNQWYIRDP